ncbi:hypothetical protein ACR5KS_06175 [Leucobacter sp. W1153]|uniref:hypothetical protein n=1 Tax=Leucobacter sp. W1153 TaxID=3439064 RepID=UPI003F3CC215
MRSSHEATGRARSAWGALLAVLTVEAFGGIAALVPITTDFLGASDEPLGPRLSIFLAALISWAWVLFTLWGAARTRASWARGSAITLHVLIFAAGTGVLQMGGMIGEPLLGWGLVLLALVGFFAALLARPMVTDPESGLAD